MQRCTSNRQDAIYLPFNIGILFVISLTDDSFDGVECACERREHVQPGFVLQNDPL